MDSINQTRLLFKQSYRTEEGAYAFFNALKDREETKGDVTTGYKAVSEIMLCKYVTNPFAKLQHFHNGKVLLERTINANPESIELHFLRYCIQKNAPGLLNYYHHLDSDKKLLVAYLQNGTAITDDPELYHLINNYLAPRPDNS